MTTNTELRLPAEWEPDNVVVIAWPHRDTDWAYMLDRISECYVNMAAAIIKYAHLIVVAPDIRVPRCRLSHLPQSRLHYFEAPTNDTWMRDSGPITTLDADGLPVINDFKFNGWGLKFASDHDNLITSRMAASGLFRAKYLNRLGFVLEGGSIESDGHGTLLTSSRCLLSPNRNGDLDRQEIEQRLRQWLGVNHILWIDHGALLGDDTDSHIDTLARLAPNDTIIYVTAPPGDPQYAELASMAEQLKAMRTPHGSPYNLLELPLPDPIYDDDDPTFRLPATYANYLVINSAVLMPAYGQSRNDELASKIIRIAYPEHDIVSVDCRALIRQHGSLHCATMQVPANALNTGLK